MILQLVAAIRVSITPSAFVNDDEGDVATPTILNRVKERLETDSGLLAWYSGELSVLSLTEAPITQKEEEREGEKQ